MSGIVRLAVLALCALWIGIPTGTQELEAQTGADAPNTGMGVVAAVGPTFQSFRFGDGEAAGLRTLSLLTLPVAASGSVGDRLQVEMNGGWARGSMTRPNGADVDLSGLLDTQIRVGSDLLAQQVRVTGTVVLPTGTDSHSNDELELAGAIAADLLPFRISNWSGGGGAGLSVSGVRSFGLTGVGVDAGFLWAGEFEPASESGAAYRPGHSIHLTAAVDRAVSATAKTTFRVDARRYGDDAVDGENLFRSGNRIGATASLSFARGATSSGVAYAGYRHRSAGTFLVDLTHRASQGVFLAGGGYRTPFYGGVLVPSADLRVLRRDDGMRQGYTVSLGAGGEWGGAGMVLLPGVRVHVGSLLVHEGVRSGFTGVDLSLRVRRGMGS